MLVGNYPPVWRIAVDSPPALVATTRMNLNPGVTIAPSEAETVTVFEVTYVPTAVAFASRKATPVIQFVPSFETSMVKTLCSVARN